MSPLPSTGVGSALSPKAISALGGDSPLACGDKQ